jgi:hypothetical protein
MPLRMVTNDYMTPLFHAAAEATEEAILNALLAAGDMKGRDGITAHGLTPEVLLGALEEARRDSRRRITPHLDESGSNPNPPAPPRF